MSREKAKATIWGLIAAGTLAALIVIGSRNLDHFDAALVSYTFATLFAMFGIAYRYYSMWLQRPATAAAAATAAAPIISKSAPGAAARCSDWHRVRYGASTWMRG
jgi:uncharacterized membrane protein YebE (DUF533 family)